MHFVNMTLRILQVLFKTDNALLNHDLYLVKDCIYEDQSFRYCKVGVKPGTTLRTGSVSQTCREVGMEAVCSGNQRCKYYTPECVVTPLSTKCYAPMYTLSSRVCNGRQPRECPALQGVFSHMSGLSGGECGVVGQTWCAKGNDITASSSRQYYAYCAERKGAINYCFILCLLIHLFLESVHKQSNQCRLPYETLNQSWRKLQSGNSEDANNCPDSTYSTYVIISNKATTHQDL